MRDTTRAKLQSALNIPEIPPHIRKQILDTMCAPSQRKLQPTGSDWGFLRAQVSHHRTMFRSNRPKWDKHYAPIYDEYVELLDRVLTNIDSARIKLQDNGEPHTVISHAKSRKAANQARDFEGRALLPICGKRWQDWIPESVRADYIDRLTLQYANDPNRTVGKRFTPFITAKERKWVKENITRLEGAIFQWRRRVITYGTSNDPNSTSDTPFGALMLAACRMAERELARRLKADPHPELPVNWRHLLTQEMRTRLREGEQHPNAIDLEGLGQFYYVMPNFDAEQARQRDEAAREHANEDTDSTHEEGGEEDNG